MFKWFCTTVNSPEVNPSFNYSKDGWTTKSNLTVTSEGYKWNTETSSGCENSFNQARRAIETITKIEQGIE